MLGVRRRFVEIDKKFVDDWNGCAVYRSLEWMCSLYKSMCSIWNFAVDVQFMEVCNGCEVYTTPCAVYGSLQCMRSLYNSMSGLWMFALLVLFIHVRIQFSDASNVCPAHRHSF